MTDSGISSVLFRKVRKGEISAAIDRLVTVPFLGKRILFWILAVFAAAWFFSQTISFIVEWDTDSPSYLVAAYGLRRNINIYDDAAFQRVADDVFGKAQLVYPYIYPPVVAQLCLPFTGLSPETYFLFLYVLNVVLTFTAAFLIVRYLELRSLPTVLAAVAPFALLVSNEPLLTTIHHGQVNLIVLNAIILFLIFQKKGKPLPAALFLSLAAAIKIYPVVFILPFIVFKRFRYLAAFGISGTAMLAASVLVSGLAPWRDFAMSTFDLFVRRPDSPFTRGFQDSLGNVSFKGFLNELLARLGAPGSLLVPAFAVLIALFILSVFAFPKRRTIPRDQALEASLLLVLTLILAPITWSHHFVLILFPAAYLIGRIVREKRYGAFCVLAVLVSQVFYAIPWGSFPYNQTRLLAMIGIFLVLLYFAKTGPEESHA